MQREILKLFVLAESMDSWILPFCFPAVLFLRLQGPEEAKNLAEMSTASFESVLNDGRVRVVGL